MAFVSTKLSTSTLLIVLLLDFASRSETTSIGYPGHSGVDNGVYDVDDFVSLKPKRVRREVTQNGVADGVDDFVGLKPKRVRREVTQNDLTQIREALRALEDDAKKAAGKNKKLEGKTNRQAQRSEEE